jgi:hypothetical protein
MHVVEAHGRLAGRTDRGIVPFPALLVNDSGEAVDAWPALAAALADLSGWLEDARTDADLDAAVRHGLALLSAGVVSGDRLDEGILSVMRQVIAWGDQVSPEFLPCSEN